MNIQNAIHNLLKVQGPRKKTFPLGDAFYILLTMKKKPNYIYLQQTSIDQI